MSTSAFQADPLLHALPDSVWRADALASQRVIPTGMDFLDAQLPGGGWPIGGMVEILQPHGVHLEWQLVLPALIQLGQGAVVLVGTPAVQPFAPSLQAAGLDYQRLWWIAVEQASEALWATEQALRCADIDAVLLWLDDLIPSPRKGSTSAALRRLQWAAAEHDTLLFVLRSPAALLEASPAGLRLELRPAPESSHQLQLHLHKRRGPPLEQPLRLPAGSPPLRLSIACQQHVVDCTAAA